MTQRRRIRRQSRPTLPEGKRPRVDPRAVYAAPQPAADEHPVRRRRDPRVEKTSRLRPDAQPKVVAKTKVDTGRIRRDPRAERGNRVRIEARPLEAAPAAPPKYRVVEAPASWVATVTCFPEAWSGAEAECLGAARQIAGDQGGVVAIRIGAPAGAGDAGMMGADRLIQLSAGIEGLVEALNVFPARHLLFAGGPMGGDLARRLAAHLGERPAIGVLAFDRDRVITPADGGRTDLSLPIPRIMTLDRNRFAPWQGQATEARVITLQPPAPAPGLPLIEEIPLPATDVPLPQADFILSAGEGVTDWPAFHALARALDAAEGGSRQVCDAGHLPRARQVGASGTLVEARCYLAFGISGAPQHLQGVQKCRHVLAVNTDLHAAMVKRADLAIIADAQEVMPALTRLMGGKP